MKIEPKEYITPDYREIMEYVEKYDIPFYIELFDSCVHYADRGNDKWLKIITSETGETFFQDWMNDRWKEKERKRKRKKRNRE